MTEIAISVCNVSKKYNLYATPQHRMIEALHPLRKKYHYDFWALQDVSFEVKKGESVGIIGRNGSGKSTLLKIITGVLTPTSGSVQVNGRLSALLELGAGFNPELTGIENIYFNGTLMGVSRDEIDERLEDILAFADIGEFVHQPVKTYSSGMFVRLAFAVSVCVEPEILIVDEALSVGDMAFQQKCLNRLVMLREKGVTILLVTHDIMLTRNYCEYVVYMQNGTVALVADSETAGEAYIKDTKSEIQVMASAVEKSWGKNNPARFGSREGEIIAVEVTNPDNDSSIFVENDPLVVTVTAIVNNTILFPRIYVQIRDCRGYVIYGSYTLPDELQKTDKDSYIEVSAALSFKVSLVPGDYSVTAAVNNAPGDTMQTILDKQVGAAVFSVLKKAGSRTVYGVVNLDAEWDKSSEPMELV